MDGLDILEIGRDALWVTVKVGGPPMIVALVVGFTISLFQALTQIQETTVSFVPKILALMGSLILFMPYMATTLNEFSHRVFDKIVAIP